MEIELKKVFVYRCCLGLKCFAITKRFAYGITGKSIVQIVRGTGTSCAHPFSSVPQAALVIDDLMYMALMDEVLYFDGSLHFLGPIELLSTSFVIDDWICTVGESFLTVFSAATKVVIYKISLVGRFFSTGNLSACSSSFVSGDSVYLGFENGKVHFIKGFREWVAREASRASSVLSNSQDAALHNFKEPVVSLAAFGPWLFLSLVSSRLVRLSLNQAEFIYTDTHAPLKKVGVCGDFLVCYSDTNILFYSFDLQLHYYHVSEFNIVNIFLLENGLQVGYECGLIVEYAMPTMHSLPGFKA